jgi:hypothetical protein
MPPAPMAERISYGPRRVPGVSDMSSWVRLSKGGVRSSSEKASSPAFESMPLASGTRELPAQPGTENAKEFAIQTCCGGENRSCGDLPPRAELVGTTAWRAYIPVARSSSTCIFRRWANPSSPSSDNRANPATAVASATALSCGRDSSNPDRPLPCAVATRSGRDG